jgi:hypothetical protein
MPTKILTPRLAAAEAVVNIQIDEMERFATEKAGARGQAGAEHQDRARPASPPGWSIHEIGTARMGEGEL